MAQPSDVSNISKPSTSSEVDVDTAEGFLKSNGFEDLITDLVVKNKFQTVDDLKLLANNIDMVKALELPICSILKLAEKLKSMKKDKEENSPKKEGEIKSKKKLLELCKTELTAQAANYAWNKFKYLISAKVKEFNLEKQWKGSGGLKACPGTSDEDSKANLELCNNILEEPDIKALYGVYKVNGAGEVHLDRLKGRKHNSSIMCSLRKPSAYQKRE